MQGGLLMDIELRGLGQALAIMDSLSANAPKELAKAMNAAANKGRSRAITRITRGYFIDKGATQGAITVKKAGGGNLEAIINVQSSPAALSKFNISPDYRPVGVRQTDGVTAQAKRNGSGKVLVHAFLVRFKSGHLGVIERKGSDRYPLKELYGPSVTGMVSADDNRVDITQSIEEAANAAIEKALSAMMGG